ncbi:MAG: pentapeptide repeat-containing protein [Ardenticatenaceae bacterium]
MALIESQTEYLNETFKKIRLDSSRIDQTFFSECVFSKCSFRETVFRKCRFNNCVFQECDLSLINVEESSFRDTKFRKSKVVGVNWALASWPHFVFQSPLNFYECEIVYSTFIGLSLQKISFKGCVAKNVDFSEADLTDANFQNAILTKSQFRNTNLTRVNFEGARDYTIDVTKNTVTKARFSLPEAYSLLHNLDGIVLVESW